MLIQKSLCKESIEETFIRLKSILGITLPLKPSKENLDKLRAEEIEGISPEVTAKSNNHRIAFVGI